MKLEHRLFQLIVREKWEYFPILPNRTLILKKKSNWLSFYHNSISGIITTVREKAFHWLNLVHVLTPVVLDCDLLSEEGMGWRWVVVVSLESNIFKILFQCCNCQFICDLSTSRLSFLIHHVIVKYNWCNYGSFKLKLNQTILWWNITFSFDYTQIWPRRDTSYFETIK